MIYFWSTAFLRVLWLHRIVLSNSTSNLLIRKPTLHDFNLSKFISHLFWSIIYILFGKILYVHFSEICILLLSGEVFYKYLFFWFILLLTSELGYSCLQTVVKRFISSILPFYDYIWLGIHL